jgi:hypothetical protein
MKSRNKKLAAIGTGLLLALSCAAQSLGGITYKPLAYKPLTNSVTIAYKPLSGALPTNAPVAKVTKQGQSPYGSSAEGYSGPYGADYSYRYSSPYLSGSGWGFNNGIYSGYGFTVHNSSRRGL